MTPTTMDEQIAAVLDAVLDPCSVAAGAPLSLMDMGLVRGWEVGDLGDLTVRLRVTSPLCTMAGHFIEDAQQRLSALAQLRSVEVVVDPALDWSPDRISPKGQKLLDRRRQLAQQRIRGFAAAPSAGP